MTTQFQQELKIKLEEEARLVQEELEVFAKKIKDADYKTVFPSFGTNEDENADEVEEYETELTIERALEAKLQAVNNALKKMEQGTYGTCETCKKEISEERLKASPSARSCLSCG